MGQSKKTHTCTLIEFICRWDFLLHEICPRENFQDSNLCFQSAFLHLVSYFFFHCRSPSRSLYTLFFAVQSDILKIVSIISPATVSVFGDFIIRTVHNNNWLTNFSGIYRTGLKQPWMLIVIFTLQFFWISFFLLNLVFTLLLCWLGWS